MNKLYRLTLCFILGFGWLFLTPAHSDDPLSIAEQQIQDLRSKVSNLNFKDDFVHLIEQAEEQYDEAVSLKQEKDEAFDAYDNALDQEARELSDVDSEQHAIDTQEESIAAKLIEKNEAQDDLDISTVNLATANTNLQNAQAAVNNAGSAGFQYTVYNLLRDGNTAITGSVICTGVWNSASMSLPVCNNRYENFIVKLAGKITVPSYWTSTYFAGYTDDGFRMYVNGSLATEQWQEQGVTWSPYTPIYDVSQNKTLNVEIWWYNGGGPGYYLLGWAIPGGWTTAGCDYTGGWGVGFSCNLNTFSHGSGPTQQQLDDLAAAQEAKNTAEQDYNTKLEIRDTKISEYNSAVDYLSVYQANLEREQGEYEEAQQNTLDALQEKQDSITEYNQGIIDLNLAINDAWKYYDAQLKRELEIAIAQALANQLQPEPTPEPTAEPEPSPEPQPSPEPTIEPSPEQTEPSDPTPTPEPETTDEPKPEQTVEPEPTTEPSPEPSPLPTDINPDPTPEPEPTPVAPSPEPSNNSSTEDLSGVIANLTSKDNKLVILTPEQVSAVSNTLSSLSIEAKIEVAKDLGIKAEEVALIAEAMKDNPILATAVVEFSSRAEENANAPMPYTLADATTELQTEAFLSDPLGALTNIDLDKILNPSEWGKDMTDDQREKAQEVVIPVIIASNIVAAAMTRRI